MEVSGWVVAYDVSDDNARRKVAATLQVGGQRLLYSVFELPLPDVAAHRLTNAAERLLGAGDRLLAVRCCPRCRQAHVGTRYEDDATQGITVV